MQPWSLAHLTLGAPPAASIAAARDAGFAGVGIRIAPRRPGEAFPVRIVGDRTAMRAIREQARDAGVAITNVQAYQFFPDTRWEDLQSIVATAHALGAPVILAYSFDPDESRFLALFARYCEEARAAGIRVAVEFLPYSRIRGLQDALNVIERSGATNAGVVVDALHLERSGGTPADVRRVEAGRIALAQLCDIQRAPRPAAEAELIAEARTARLPPGDGDLPLLDLLDALPEDVDIEYEVAPAARAAWSPDAKARIARSDIDRFLATYHAHRARHHTAT